MIDTVGRRARLKVSDFKSSTAVIPRPSGTARSGGHCHGHVIRGSVTPAVLFTRTADGINHGCCGAAGPDNY